MADTPISGLPAAGALAGTEPVPVVQAGTTVRTTTTAIAALAPQHPSAGAAGDVQLSDGAGGFLATDNFAYLGGELFLFLSAMQISNVPFGVDVVSIVVAAPTGYALEIHSPGSTLAHPSIVSFFACFQDGTTGDEFAGRFRWSDTISLINEVTLGTDSYALRADDSANVVELANTVEAVRAVSGAIRCLGIAGNTFTADSGIAAPTPQTLLALPLSVYGQGTILHLLGDPAAWLLVRVAGVNYRVPLYL